MSAPTSSFQFTVAFCRGEPVCSPAFASRRVRFSVRHSGACRNQGGRDIHWFWSTLRLPPASAGMTAVWPIANNARGSTLPSPDSIGKTGRTRRSAPTGMRRTREQDCLKLDATRLTAHRPAGAPSRLASGLVNLSVANRMRLNDGVMKQSRPMHKTQIGGDILRITLYCEMVSLSLHNRYLEPLQYQLTSS